MADYEIAILGAGLCGLSLAVTLAAKGRDVVLLEARDRPGGRVLSQEGYDLGPAWIWPHNRRLLKLAAHYGLPLFEQHVAGRLILEEAQGTVRRDLEFATMGGALRMTGGLSRLTDALAAGLGARLRLGAQVHQIRPDPHGVTLSGEGFELRAGHAVLALPPRLARGLGFDLPDAPTWMAGHAKLVAVYDAPFWRAAGFNGDAISHRGPLAEIHDASAGGPDPGEGALFGFARPGAARAPEFRAQALDQLARLFGPEAARPRAVHFKDWSTDALTATKADLLPPPGHPRYHAIAPQGRVIFSGTETAVAEGGFLEGALEAAEAAEAQLTRHAL